jgi:hypothetical protein
MLGEWWIGNDLEGTSRVLFEVISWHFSGGTEEDHENTYSRLLMSRPRYIVAYKPVAKRLFCKHQSLLVMPARNNTGCVTICDAYSRCYVAPAAYACVVTSHNNRRGDAGWVLCGSAPRLYDSTDRVLLNEWVQWSWGFSSVVLTSNECSEVEVLAL